MNSQGAYAVDLAAPTITQPVDTEVTLSAVTVTGAGAVNTTIGTGITLAHGSVTGTDAMKFGATLNVTSLATPGPQTCSFTIVATYN